MEATKKMNWEQFLKEFQGFLKRQDTKTVEAYAYLAEATVVNKHQNINDRRIYLTIIDELALRVKGKKK